MIGLLGGTFDPVHHGHLRLALEMKERLGLDQVRLLPAGDPWQRPPPGADGAQRLAMLERAIAGVPGLVTDARELRRDGPTYTVDTLEELRREVGTTPLVWLLGMDAFAGLPGWHEWQALPDLAHLAVARRPGAALTSTGELAKMLAERETADVAALARRPAGHIHVTDMPLLDIAATGIRAIIAARRDASFLTPRPVLEFIHAEKLYRDAA